MDLISPSLLANIPKRSKKCHEQFHLGMGKRTESSDESSEENEAPKLKPLKKLKLIKEKSMAICGRRNGSGFSKLKIPL